jgi:hypothetical protein
LDVSYQREFKNAIKKNRAKISSASKKSTYLRRFFFLSTAPLDPVLPSTRKRPAASCRFDFAVIAGVYASRAYFTYLPDRYEKGSTNQKVPIRLQFHVGAINFTK